jgi:hypothetical protein
MNITWRALLVCAGVGVSGAANADGLAARVVDVPEPARRVAAAEIAKAKVAEPETFEAVRKVHGVRREFYGRLRNPIPMASRELRALGPSALWAMVDALAFDAPPRGELNDEEWTALTAGLLEAVGALRDPRSGPVLGAVFENGPASPRVRTAAAKALGRLCGDAELGVLVKHLPRGDARRLAAIHGLGECRRAESVDKLAGLLSAETDPATVEALASALGAVGSSWAWKAMGPEADATGLAVRKAAATALVAAYAGRSAETRASLSRAIAAVDQPETLALIDQARARVGADAEAQAALDRLSRTFKRRQAR